MRPSRREAIKLGAAAGVAIAVDLGWVVAETAVSALGTAAMPTRTMLEDTIGEVFRVARGGSGSVDLRLMLVRDLACAHATGLGGHDACFTAVFHGPLDPPIAQDTYRLWNETLGAFDLFIVPGSTDTLAVYIATFNRVAPAST